MKRPGEGKEGTSATHDILASATVLAPAARSDGAPAREAQPSQRDAGRDRIRGARGQTLAEAARVLSVVGGAARVAEADGPVRLKSSFAFGEDDIGCSSPPYFSCGSEDEDGDGGRHGGQRAVHAALLPSEEILATSLAVSHLNDVADLTRAGSSIQPGRSIRGEEREALEREREASDSDHYHSAESVPGSPLMTEGELGGHHWIGSNAELRESNDGSNRSAEPITHGKTASTVSFEGGFLSAKEYFDVGLWWLIHNNKMVVAGFDANCPGRKQIRPGDILRKVDGVDVLTMTVQSDGTHEAEHLLMGEANTACTLTLIRAVGDEGSVKFEEYTAQLQRTMLQDSYTRKAQQSHILHQEGSVESIASTQSQTSAASNETDAPRPHSLDGLDRLASRQDILGALQTPGTEYFWS